MLFDQYQRYKNAEIIINSVRKEGERFRILEVGANEHKNLEKFLPDDKITYLDIILSEERKNDPAYIQGDASQMDLENCSYDIIVSLDMFEHVLPKRRQAFLSEINRVASRLFIIGAPFHTAGVSESEKRVNSAYRCLYGTNHPWLIEHIQNGLPDLDQTSEYLRDIGCKVSVFSHGDLRLWERLTNIELASDMDEELLNYAEHIYDVYNKYLFQTDYGKNSYRQFLIGTKDDYKFEFNIEINELEHLEQLNELEKQFWTLHGNVKLKREINTLNLSSREEYLTIYFDEGWGFSEERKKKVTLYEDRVVLKVGCSDFRNIQQVRIDPIDNAGVVKINKIVLLNKYSDCVWELKNHIFTENLIFSFENRFGFREDAQILIPTPSMDVETIELDYEYYSMSIKAMHEFNDFVSQLKEYQKIVSSQNDKLSENAEALKEANHELENYKAQYFAVMEAYSSILNSECWKITTPLRFLIGKLRRNS